MPKYSYAIGTIAAGLGACTNVEALAAGVVNVPPEALAVKPYSVYRTAANGLEYGDGFPECEWRFSVMEQAQLDALLTYLDGAQSKEVYIRTRTDDRTYSYYRAVMHRPKGDEYAPRYSNRWGDITIRFTMLVEQADPA